MCMSEYLASCHNLEPSDDIVQFCCDLVDCSAIGGVKGCKFVLNLISENAHVGDELKDVSVGNVQLLGVEFVKFYLVYSEHGLPIFNNRWDCPVNTTLQLAWGKRDERKASCIVKYCVCGYGGVVLACVISGFGEVALDNNYVASLYCFPFLLQFVLNLIWGYIGICREFHLVHAGARDNVYGLVAFSSHLSSIDLDDYVYSLAGWSKGRSIDLDGFNLVVFSRIGYLQNEFP